MTLKEAVVILNESRHGGHSEWRLAEEDVWGKEDHEAYSPFDALCIAWGYQSGLTLKAVEEGLAEEFAVARAEREQKRRERELVHLEEMQRVAELHSRERQKRIAAIKAQLSVPPPEWVTR